MERYIGMDVHAASCTLAVISEKGRKLKDFYPPSISFSFLRSKLSKKDTMSASRIQLTSPRCTIRSRTRTASWALRLGRKPCEQSKSPARKWLLEPRV